MNKPAQRSSFGGAIGREFNELRSAILALWPSSVDGQTRDITTQGTVLRRVASASGTGVKVEQFDVLAEGPDALLCRSYGEGDAAEVIVAKPVALRKATWLPYVGLDVIQHNQYVRELTGVLENTFSSGTGATEYVRDVRYQADDILAEDKDAQLVIHLPYRNSTSLGPVLVGGVKQVLSTYPLTAARLNTSQFSSSPTGLESGSGSESVVWLDMNLEARAWTPRPVAQGHAYIVSDYTGIPREIVLTAPI